MGGLGSGKLLGAAAFIREQPQWDQQPIFFSKDESNHSLKRGCNGTGREIRPIFYSPLP